jgi:hypothetical protein
MNETATGGPAFPAQFFDERATGMTLRDHFAGLAMQGLLSGGPNALVGSNKKLVPFAYEIADAMLKERSATKAA